MSRVVSCLFAFISLAAPCFCAPLAKTDSTGLSLNELKAELQKIDTELGKLARSSFLAGVGAIGYRSGSRDRPDSPEWIKVEWEKEVPIDEIILVPTLWRSSLKGATPDGFPEEFRVLAGKAGDETGVEIAAYTRKDKAGKGTSPFVIDGKGVTASWIMVDASLLSMRGYDNRYILQFSEILVFHGETNVALLQKVSTSTDSKELPNPWNDHFAVDGFVPYVMDAASGEQSLAFVSRALEERIPVFEIDLGQQYPLSRIHIHAVEQGDTIPQAYPGDFGIPRLLVVEGANLPDFSDAFPLVEIRQNSIYECGSIMMRNFPEKACRYVRLTALEMKPSVVMDQDETKIGFAEIELFSGSRNVAMGKPMKTDILTNSPERSPAALTDGHLLYGNSLPIRDWLHQLTRREALETARPLIVAEINRRYDRLKRWLIWLTWLATALAAGTFLVILNSRFAKHRAIIQTRERIAADLHDELGANINAIGLLGDLAEQATDSPERLKILLRRSRAFTERTAAAARHCTNILEAKGLYGDLEQDMRNSSRRIMADLEHEIEVKGRDVLERLAPRKRIDLFLFYKESITNIIRHSEATKVTTRLIAHPKQIRLTITDNGLGLTEQDDGQVPHSLKRRAKLIGAKVSSERPSNGGTRIRLSFALKRRYFQKPKPLWTKSSE
ncbi:MAG: sensor histidine kinase [Luteolibacter sp.]